MPRNPKATILLHEIERLEQNTRGPSPSIQGGFEFLRRLSMAIGEHLATDPQGIHAMQEAFSTATNSQLLTVMMGTLQSSTIAAMISNAAVAQLALNLENGTKGKH